MKAAINMQKNRTYLNIYMKVMGGPIVRLSIYILIAALTSLMNDFSKYQTLDEITQVTWIMIWTNFFLQGLIAWRAYIDGSYPRAVEQLQEGKRLAQRQAELTQQSVQGTSQPVIINEQVVR